MFPRREGRQQGLTVLATTHGLFTSAFAGRQRMLIVFIVHTHRDRAASSIFALANRSRALPSVLLGRQVTSINEDT